MINILFERFEALWSKILPPDLNTLGPPCFLPTQLNFFPPYSLLLEPTCLHIIFEEKFQPTLLLAPHLVLET